MSAVNQIRMPMLGFGTWQIPASDAEKLVSTALKVGYTHIDCAEIYRNEAEIGKCFEKLPNRSELYIVSKLWSGDHEPHKVHKAIEKTLNNLKLDYLDMYLIHNPIRMDDSMKPLWYKKEWILETWREMVKIKDSGKAKNIGVSNFSTTKLQWLLDEGEKPSNNQGICIVTAVELHPYLPQNHLVKFCKEHGILRLYEGIVLTGYSTLGTPGTATSWPGLIYENSPVLLKDPVIHEIASKLSATPAQVLIKWGTMRGYPVLVKSSIETRMKENLDALNLKIDDQDFEKINEIQIRCRYCTFKPFCPEGHTDQELFDGEFLG